VRSDIERIKFMLLALDMGRALKLYDDAFRDAEGNEVMPTGGGWSVAKHAARVTPAAL
jgi:hypothetical protein